MWGNQKHTMNILSRPSAKTGAQWVNNTGGLGFQKRNHLPSTSILVTRVQAADTYTSNFQALTGPRKHSLHARVFPVSSPTANAYEPHISSYMIWILWLFLVTLSRNKAVEGSNTPLSCLQPLVPPPSLRWSEHLVHVQIKTGFIWHYFLIYFLLSWQYRQTMGEDYNFIWHCKLLLDDIMPNELLSISLFECICKEVFTSFWEVPVLQWVHMTSFLW